MRGNRSHRAAALALELAPAALLNFAVAFFVANLMRQNGLAGLAAGASVASGTAAFLLAWYLLRRADRPRGGFHLPIFEEATLAAHVEPEESPLLLTERVEAQAAGQQPAAGELLLDDILQSIGPESRVVRLFDPERMPSAGELQARIDRHLGTGAARPAVPDATDALHEAIADLRRSLR